MLESLDVILACSRCDQSLVAVTGDSDNSLSSHWVKFVSRGAMNHAPGFGPIYRCTT